MMEQRPAWQISEDGLEIWVSGEKVATIPKNDIIHLMVDIAKFLKHRIKVDAKS